MARVLDGRAVPRQAFTLAEIVVALGLFVIAVLSAVALAISALRSNQKGSDQMVANALAGRVLEEFVYSLPDASDSFWTRTTFASPYELPPVANLGTGVYQPALYLTDLASVGQGMKMATVNVTWGNGVAGQTGYGQQVASISRLIYAH